RGRRGRGEPAAADDVRRQRVAGCIEQLRTREAKERAAHIELIRQAEGTHDVARSGIGSHHRERQPGRVATIAWRWCRNDRQTIRVWLPEEALHVEACLDPKRTIDPGLAAVGERRQVVSLSPYEQAVRRGLQCV